MICKILVLDLSDSMLGKDYFR